MAIIRPFAPFIPRSDIASEVASVPYDVVETGEARALASGKPFSFLRVIRPEIDLSDDIDPHDPQVYEKGSENLRRFIDDGIMKQESESALYVYRLRDGDHVQTGVVGCCSVAEYSSGIIKRHEQTRPDKEEDRVRHMKALEAHAGPVLMTYRRTREAAEGIRAALAAESTVQLFDFEAHDGVRHTIWRIAGSEDLVDAFARIPAFYIADGHHRAATAARIHRDLAERPETAFFLSVVFPENEMRICPYDRYVRLSPEEAQNIAGKTAELFDLRDAGSPPSPGKGEVAVYHRGGWRVAELPEAGTRISPVESLDLSRFQTSILEPIVGITDQRTDPRIEFVGGDDSYKKLERLVDSNGGIAFSLHPVAIEELMSIADADGEMPPKSTWFAPKLRSGLFVHAF